MSLLIRGMEMPKNCFICPFKNLEICDEDCPLVEVPPHGDLIDRMALLESIKEARKKDPDVEDVYTEDYFTVAEWLMSAPKVIEAEAETWVC